MLIESANKVINEHIPGQTRDGGKDVELRTSNDKVDDHHHEDCASLGASGLIKRLDDRVQGGCVGNLVKIAM